MLASPHPTLVKSDGDLMRPFPSLCNASCTLCSLLSRFACALKSMCVLHPKCYVCMHADNPFHVAFLRPVGWLFGLLVPRALITGLRAHPLPLLYISVAACAAFCSSLCAGIVYRMP